MQHVYVMSNGEALLCLLWFQAAGFTLVIGSGWLYERGRELVRRVRA